MKLPISDRQKQTYQYGLAEETKVLTQCGWKTVETIQTTDKLWNGKNWIPHKGIEYLGYKWHIERCELSISAEYKILIPTTESTYNTTTGEWDLGTCKQRQVCRLLSENWDGAKSVGTNSLPSIDWIIEGCGQTGNASGYCKSYDVLLEAPSRSFTVGTDTGAVIITKSI